MTLSQTQRLDRVFAPDALPDLSYLVKLDVDGVEEQIIAGGQRVLRNASFVIIETRHQWQRLATLACFQRAFERTSGAGLTPDIAVEQRACSRFGEAEALLAALLERERESPRRASGVYPDPGDQDARRGWERKAALACFQRAFGLRSDAAPPGSLGTEERKPQRLDAAATVPEAPPERAGASLQARISDARDCRQRGDGEAALAHFRAALELQPDHPTLSTEMAALLRELGRLHESEALLSDLLRWQPDNYRVWHERAWNARKRRDDEAALSHCRRAVALAPEHPTLQADMAADLRALGRLDEAEAALNELFARQPHSYRVWTERAQIARARQDCDGALAHFRRAITLAPEQPSLLADMAAALRELGRLDEAEAVLCELVAKQPDSYRAWTERAWNARRRQDREAALAHCRRALVLKPDHPTLPAELAADLCELGRWDEAEAVLSALLARHPLAAHRVWSERARIARKRHDRATALAHGDRALALEPEDPDLLADRAADLRELGRLDEAEAVLSALLARQPDAYRVWSERAWAARRQQDGEAALAHFRAALARKPGHPTLPAEIATELRELGRLDEAEAVLEAHRAQLVPLALYWEQRGRLALYRDAIETAFERFEAGIEADPKHPACYLALASECQRLGLFERAEQVLAQGRQRVGANLPLALMQVRLLKARGFLDAALEQLQALWVDHPGELSCGLLLAELQTQLAAFAEAEAVLTTLGGTLASTQAWFQLAMGRAQLARAQYDLDAAERALLEALALNPDDAGAHHLLAQVHLMRGDSEAAQAPLAVAQARLAAHGAERVRAGAHGGLRHQFWREFRTNPFAEQALRAALTRPLAEQPRAIAEVLQTEPEHAGSAIALLVALRRTGVWERHGPNPALGHQSPIPPRILQFWDTPEIPDDMLETVQSWPDACPGFEHQVFNDASAAAFLQRECAREVQRAYRQAGHAAMRADLFRLAYLAVRGGLYADADDRCRHSLHDWLAPGYDLLLLQEDVGSIGNNFIAAAPGHPFIHAALAQVTRNILDKQGDTIWFISGPGALSVAFTQWLTAQGAGDEVPAGVRVRDVYQMQQRISMHLPRAYKQDARHWSSVQAQGQPMFQRALSVRRRGIIQ